jgi:multiple antibiotic resistance protein
MDLFSLAVTFFIIADPVGNIPAVASLIKDFSFERQKKIMARECFLALLFAIAFSFLGEPFLKLIGIQTYTMSIAGGVLLFIIGLQMLYPPEKIEIQKNLVEPFFVPIAVPLVSGGALMSSIIFYSSLISDPWTISLALIIAWIGVTPILMLAPYLQKILGKRGIIAMEQLMGLILILISTQLIVNGAHLFYDQLN